MKNLSLLVGVIPDLHGHNTWKKFVNENMHLDKLVFLGDYVDDYLLSNEEIYSNFVEIIEFKKEHPDKVELLIGNHELSYIIVSIKYRAEGFRSDMANQLEILLKENRKLFKIAYQYKNYLFTHAGVSNKWYNKYKVSIVDFYNRFKQPEDDFILADVFNNLYETQYRDVLFEMSNIRNKVAVNGRIAGILWADISETKDDYLDGYHQIVGHTPINQITTLNYKDSSITYTDCLGEKEEFLILEIK